MTHIKHRDKLLSEIAEGLAGLGRTDVGCVEVIFICGGHHYAFGLSQALGCLADDIFWDERGDWREATRAEVRAL